MKKLLGRMELQMLAYVQLRKIQVVKTGDLMAPLSISADQERELLSRMNRGGIIARIRPGLYVVPARLPLGGAWSPDISLILKTLMEDCGGKYQICGPNAFNRYGFVAQIPARYYIYNDKLSGKREISSIPFIFIKTSRKRLGGTEKVKCPEGGLIMYSSRARTLVDAVYDWSRFNSMPEAYEWIKTELNEKNVSINELLGIALKFGDVGTRRRIGFLLEKYALTNDSIKELNESINTTQSFIPFVPGKEKKGKTNRRWGIIDNENF